MESDGKVIIESSGIGKQRKDPCGENLLFSISISHNICLAAL